MNVYDGFADEEIPSLITIIYYAHWDVSAALTSLKADSGLSVTTNDQDALNGFNTACNQLRKSPLHFASLLRGNYSYFYGLIQQAVASIQYVDSTLAVIFKNETELRQSLAAQTRALTKERQQLIIHILQYVTSHAVGLRLT